MRKTSGTIIWEETKIKTAPFVTLGTDSKTTFVCKCNAKMMSKCLLTVLFELPVNESF